MTVATTAAPPAPAPPGEPAPTATRRTALLVATLSAAAGVAVVVARDGTPAWQVVRLVATAGLAALAVRGVTRPGRRARALTAIAAGLVTVPVGIGIAVPHLAKSGIGLESLAGLALLGGGLVLLVAGTVTAVRSLSRWWRVPAAGAVVIGCLLLTWSLGQAVAATNVPRTSLGRETPADRGIAYRDVEFPAADGVTLSGWFIPGRNGAAVVLLHGAGSTRSAVLDHALVLNRNGFAVLLFDARGHGRSAGRAMDFGWYGDRDVAGAVAFLEHQDGVDPRRIGAVGMSMGGEEAIGAAASVGGIAAVVAEGATNRVAGDKAWMSDAFGIRGAVTEGLEALTYAFADVLTDAHPPITLHDAVRAAAPRPVLLIAAGNVPDEARAARYIQRGAPDTVEVWVADGAGHTRALATDPAAWESRVVAFLDRALAVR